MTHSGALTVICPYCGAKARFADSAEVYGGRSYGMAYICSNYPSCDAYVGVHKGTVTPLGRMANAELREAKKQAHAAFDPLWKNGRFPRKLAYLWLSEQLGMAREDCHIGMFDVATCRRVVDICKRKADA